MTENGLKIIVRGCHNLAPLFEFVKKLGGGQADDVQVSLLPCSGKIEPHQILKFFEQGADGALILACPEGVCKFVEGNKRAKKRAAYAGQWLKELGIAPERIRFHNFDYKDEESVETLINDFKESVVKMGSTGITGG